MICNMVQNVWDITRAPVFLALALGLRPVCVCVCVWRSMALVVRGCRHCCQADGGQRQGMPLWLVCDPGWVQLVHSVVPGGGVAGLGSRCVVLCGVRSPRGAVALGGAGGASVSASAFAGWRWGSVRLGGAGVWGMNLRRCPGGVCLPTAR